VTPDIVLHVPPSQKACPGDQGIRALPEDLRRGVAGHEPNLTPGWGQILIRALFTLRIQAVILFRLSQSGRGITTPLGVVIKYFNHALTGADIASEASIGPGLIIWHPTGIVIGPGCRVGRGCTIMQGVTLGAGPNGRSAVAGSRPDWGGSPTLGDEVYVGPGAQVLGGIEIGAQARIGANAVVLQDVPARAFAAGVPAIVRPRDEL